METGRGFIDCFGVGCDRGSIAVLIVFRATTSHSSRDLVRGIQVYQTSQGGSVLSWRRVKEVQSVRGSWRY